MSTTEFRLGDVLRIRNDVVHPRDNPSGAAVFVGLEHVEPGTGRRIGAMDVRLEGLTGRKPQFFRGDLVYGYLRPYLNKVWIAEFDGLCSVDQYVYAVNNEIADTEFVAHFMRSAAFLRAAPIDNVPGQLPRIRKEEVANVVIALPSLPDQRRIAADLTAQLAAVAEARAAAEARVSLIAEAELRLFEEAFSDTDSLCPIGKVARVQSGFAFKSVDFQKTGIRLLRNTNILPQQVYWDEVVCVTAEMAERSTAYALATGDILLSLDRPIISSGIKVARVGAEDLPALLLQRVGRFKCDYRVVDPDYLYAFLQSPQFIAAISGHEQSLGVPHISPGQVEAVEIPLPDLEDQRSCMAQLGESIAAVRMAYQAAKSQLADLDALPSRILAETFSNLE